MSVFQLGKWQTLNVRSVEEIGAYLELPEDESISSFGDSQNRVSYGKAPAVSRSRESGSAEKVLLPKKQVPAGSQPGDPIEVFLYRDSSDRMIATVHKPKITIGDVAVLKVKQVTSIGAFLDWGLEKDLLLPYRQQTEKVEEGKYYLVALYVDKTDRLAATMWVEKYLSIPDMDEKRHRLSMLHLEADAENVFVTIQKMGGLLPYNDHAEADQIKADFGLSKNAFKRAVGVLYKARRLEIREDSIVLL